MEQLEIGSAHEAIEETYPMNYRKMHTVDAKTKTFIDDAFKLINQDMESDRERIIAGVRAEMAEMKQLPERRKIFNEKFKVRNHMLLCKIKNISYIKKNDKRIKLATQLPLIELSKRIKGAYYGPWVFPALLIFHPDHPCTANLSPKGVLNLTGGYNIKQVKDALCYFVSVILGTLNEIEDCQYVLDDIKFKLRMVTNKIGGFQIQCKHLSNLCQRNNIICVLQPSRINRPNIVPFPETLPSVGIQVFPAGGVNFSGFKGLVEAELVIELLERLLWPTLRTDHNFEGWEKYNRMREEKELSLMRNALVKKEKNMAKWEGRTKEKIERNVYDAWIMVNSDRKAKSFLKDQIKIDDKLKEDLKRQYKKKPKEFAKVYEKTRRKDDYVDLVVDFKKKQNAEVKRTKRATKLQDVDFDNYFAIKNHPRLDVTQNDHISLRKRILEVKAIEKYFKNQ